MRPLLPVLALGGAPILTGRQIAEAFKRIRHRLQLEHASGLSWHAARQDLGARGASDNLDALAVHVANGTVPDHGAVLPQLARRRPTSSSHVPALP
ncbi:MAG: hypothetical protein AW08_01349 [Candidatus Accumulibacter adjunctus]|uniref:Uncharacterized protein n=1 Tax=Candidatus Accumulibacter adjunctus TaxID=1454001 RepID=A0A011MZW8_9PROT|nr:MAG: hypothetical protein AW08_01349 [Candidatus Accumulibacter adjunctus]